MDIFEFYNAILREQLPNQTELLLSRKMSLSLYGIELEPMDSLTFVNTFEKKIKQFKKLIAGYIMNNKTIVSVLFGITTTTAQLLDTNWYYYILSLIKVISLSDKKKLIEKLGVLPNNDENKTIEELAQLFKSGQRFSQYIVLHNWVYVHNSNHDG